MPPDERDDGGWGERDMMIPHDILTVYNPNGKWEKENAATSPDFSHEGCLFVRDCSPGQMTIMSAEDVARILPSGTHSLSLRKRMAEGIVRFSREQKASLAAVITDEGIAAIRELAPSNAHMIQVLREGGLASGVATSDRGKPQAR